MDMEKMLRDPYGSNRSSRSGKSLSIFQNPNASQTLARDEELTYTMYGGYGGGDGGLAYDRRSVASSSLYGGARSVGEGGSVLSTTSSKVVNNKRISNGTGENSKTASVNPVELKGFTYHNGVLGNGVESDIGRQRSDMYTRTDGIENKYSRYNDLSTENLKPEVRSGSDKLTITKTAETTDGMNGARNGLNGLDTIELGSGDLDTITVESSKVSKQGVSGMAPTTTRTTTTTKEGPSTTVTNTVTKTTATSGGGSGNRQTETQIKTTQVTKSGGTKIANGPRGGERKAGAFTMKPASNWPLERSESNSSAQSTEFKSSLDDTLSRRVKGKTTVENGEDGTLADTESINASRTNSMQRDGKNKQVSRTLSGASRVSQKSGLTDNSSIPEESVRGSAGLTKRVDSYNSDLAQLVRDQDRSRSVSRASSQASQKQGARSSLLSQQTENMDRYMRTIVSPVDTDTNLSTNEDTLDRLVREEKARGKQSAGKRGSSTSTHSYSVTTTKSSSSGPTTTQNSYGINTNDDAVKAKRLSASKTTSNDPFAKLEQMTLESEGKFIASTERVDTKVEKSPAEGLQWFASSGSANHERYKQDSSVDEESVDEDQMTATKMKRGVESDPFSKIGESSSKKAVYTYSTSNSEAPSTSASQAPSASVSRGSSFHQKEAGKFSLQTGANDFNESSAARGQDNRIVSPTAAAAKSDEFKSKLSSLMQSSGDSSTTSSVAGGKSKSDNLRLNISQETRTITQSDSAASPVHSYPSNSLPRDPNTGLVGSATPTSPIEEVRSQVREGTVGKIKHAFKDIQLTGGLAPSTLERKKQTDTSETESDTGTGKKKFKFAVEGIDVPAPEPIEPAPGSDTAPSTLTRDGQVGLPPPPPLSSPPPLSPNSLTPVASPSEFESSEADTLERKSLDRKKKGFSYLLDEKLAGEIKRRADTVQARKPHETLQAKENRKSTIREEESEVLKEARSKLHHKDLLKEIESRKPKEKEEESDLLKEARAKLQHRQKETQETRQMAQQPPAPSPIQAHMLLAQKAKLQKRSQAKQQQQQAGSDSAESTEPETHNRPSGTKGESHVQKIADPVVPKSEPRKSTQPPQPPTYAQVKKAAERSSSISKKEISSGSSGTDRVARKDSKRDSKTSTDEKVELRSSVLRSASIEKRNSQTFYAKPSDKTKDKTPTVGIGSQSEERHVGQTSQETSKTTTVSSKVTTDNQQKTVVDVDSPDSAYQSDAQVSPAYDLKPLLQSENIKHPPVQEVEVRYAKPSEPVPSTSKDMYQAKHTVVKEVKSSSRVSASNKDGKIESKEIKRSQKSEYNSLTQPDRNSTNPHLTTKSSLVTTKNNQQLKDGKVISDQTTRDRREDVQSQPAISQQDIINAALTYRPTPASDMDQGNQRIDEPAYRPPTIDSKPDHPAANQPSATEFTATASLPRPTNKTPQAEPVQIKVTSLERSESAASSQPSPRAATPKGPYTFVVPVTLDSTESSPRYVTDGNTHWVQGRQREALTEARPDDQWSVTDDQGLLNTDVRRRPTSRQESFNSTSTYTTQSSIGSHRVIQLKPISVDVGGPRSGGRRPREMKTHPHSPGVHSPTRNTHYMSQPRTSSQPRGQRQKQNRMRQPNSRSEGRGRRERSRSREDHLEVNIYGEDGGDSTPSPHSPPNRYMKVDEGRSGRVPRYRVKDISVRNGVDSGHEYHSSAEFSPRGKKGPHVSNIHVDGDYIDYDSGSAYSEPARHMGRSLGKYSVQKIMDRRGVSNVTPLDLHPDNTVIRKQRVYQVQRDSSFASNRSGLNAMRHPPQYDGTMRSNVHDSTLRSVNQTMESHRSGVPDVAAVDPDLLDANKTGKEYNVSLKLNAMIGSRPGSKMSWEQEELNQAANVSQYEREYRQPNGNDQNGRFVSTVMNYDDYNDWEARQFEPSYGQGRSQDDFVVTSVQRTPSNSLSNSRHMSRSMTDTREMHHQQFRQVARPRDRVDIDIELAPEDYAMQTQTQNVQSFQRNTRLRRSKSDPSMAKKFANSSLEPKFSMTINQTMTMDYTPQEGEEDIDDNNNRRRNQGNERPPRRKPRRQSREPVEAPPRYPSDSEETVDDPVERSRNKMNERPPEPQWPDSDDGQDDLPQVLRGSILIKNTIDTVGKPRVIDVVDGEDSDEDYLVDDNTNLFDKRFLASKTNPLYDSDNEDSPEGPKKPKFTDIFKQTTVTNGAAFAAPKSSSRKSKARLRAKPPANGYDDESDYGFDETVTKTTTYNVHAEGGRNRAKVPRGGEGGRSSRTVEQKSEWHINKLLAGAPPDSIKQTINVEREEEEIMGPLPASHADGTAAGPDGLLNFDTVSEKVDLGMLDGKAQVAVKVRCERIVPIRGVDDMFKKSSVIVTRLIEIDLTATDERRRLYEHIMRNQNRPMITSGDGAKSKFKASDRKLSTKETFKLYKTFMGLAEADEAGQGQTESLQIDRSIDEQRRPDLQSAAMNGLPARLDDDEFGYDGGREFDTNELERQLEDTILPGKTSRVPEPDTISYMSAASSVNDILY